MVDELGLVECIDPMMPQDLSQRTVSIGLAECRLTAPPRQASPATPPEEGNFGRGARRAGYSPPLEGCPKGGVFPSPGGVPEGRDIPLLWRGARRAGYSPPLEGCPKGGVVLIPPLWRGARRAGYSPPLEGCPKGGIFPPPGGVPEGRDIPLPWRGARRAGWALGVV